MAEKQKQITQRLLEEAHSPTAAQRIFSEKIEHRKLFVRPNSPPPRDARAARRNDRQACEGRKHSKALKPKPLSARERRRLHVYDVPHESKKYAVFEPLHNMWLGYIYEILGEEVYTGGLATAAKLTSAEFVGAKLLVTRSSCPSRVGICGIVIKDSKFVFEIINEKNAIKTIPKEGTLFRVDIPPPEASGAPGKRQDASLIVEIHGEQFQHRPADRSNKKFKTHFLNKM